MHYFLFFLHKKCSHASKKTIDPICDIIVTISGVVIFECVYPG